MKSLLTLLVICGALSRFVVAGESTQRLIVVREYRVPANAFPAPELRPDGQPNWEVRSGVTFEPPPIPSYLYIPSSHKLIVRGDLNHQREAKKLVANLWRKAKQKKGSDSK